MPRYHLYLTARPAADRKALDLASARCPATLDHEALIAAGQGKGELEEWVQIARTDKRADVKRIRRELGKLGCAIAEEDAGGSALSSLKAIGEELLDPERRAAARARRSTRGPEDTSWWSDRLRPILAVTSLLVVLAGIGFVGIGLLGGGMTPRGSDDGQGGELPTLKQANLDQLEAVAGGEGESAQAEQEAAGRSTPSPTDRTGGNSDLPDVGYREDASEAREKAEALASEHPLIALLLAGACGLLAAALFQVSLINLPFTHDWITRFVAEVLPPVLLSLTCAALLLFGPTFLRIRAPAGAVRIDASAKGEKGEADTTPDSGEVATFQQLLRTLPSATSATTASDVPFATLLWHMQARTSAADDPRLGHDAPSVDESFTGLVDTIAARRRCDGGPGPFTRMLCTLDERAQTRERQALRLAPPGALGPHSLADTTSSGTISGAKARISRAPTAEAPARIERETPLARTSRGFLGGLGSGSLLGALFSLVRLRRHSRTGAETP